MEMPEGAAREEAEGQEAQPGPVARASRSTGPCARSAAAAGDHAGDHDENDTGSGDSCESSDEDENHSTQTREAARPDPCFVDPVVARLLDRLRLGSLAPPSTPPPGARLLERREAEPPPPPAEELKPEDVLALLSQLRVYADLSMLESPEFHWFASRPEPEVLAHDWRGTDYAAAALRLALDGRAAAKHVAAAAGGMTTSLMCNEAYARIVIGYAILRHGWVPIVKSADPDAAEAAAGAEGPAPTVTLDGRTEREWLASLSVCTGPKLQVLLRESALKSGARARALEARPAVGPRPMGIAKHQAAAAAAAAAATATAAPAAAAPAVGGAGAPAVALSFEEITALIDASGGDALAVVGALGGALVQQQQERATERRQRPSIRAPSFQEALDAAKSRGVSFDEAAVSLWQEAAVAAGVRLGDPNLTCCKRCDVPLLRRRGACFWHCNARAAAEHALTQTEMAGTSGVDCGQGHAGRFTSFEILARPLRGAAEQHPPKDVVVAAVVCTHCKNAHLQGRTRLTGKVYLGHTLDGEPCRIENAPTSSVAYPRLPQHPTACYTFAGGPRDRLLAAEREAAAAAATAGTGAGSGAGAGASAGGAGAGASTERGGAVVATAGGFGSGGHIWGRSDAAAAAEVDRAVVAVRGSPPPHLGRRAIDQLMRRFLPARTAGDARPYHGGAGAIIGVTAASAVPATSRSNSPGGSAPFNLAAANLGPLLAHYTHSVPWPDEPPSYLDVIVCALLLLLYTDGHGVAALVQGGQSGIGGLGGLYKSLGLMTGTPLDQLALGAQRGAATYRLRRAVAAAAAGAAMFARGCSGSSCDGACGSGAGCAGRAAREPGPPPSALEVSYGLGDDHGGWAECPYSKAYSRAACPDGRAGFDLLARFEVDGQDAALLQALAASEDDDGGGGAAVAPGSGAGSGWEAQDPEGSAKPTAEGDGGKPGAVYTICIYRCRACGNRFTASALGKTLRAYLRFCVGALGFPSTCACVGEPPKTAAERQAAQSAARERERAYHKGSARVFGERGRMLRAQALGEGGETC